MVVVIPSDFERDRLKHKHMIAIYRFQEVQDRVRARQMRVPASTPPPLTMGPGTIEFVPESDAIPLLVKRAPTYPNM